MKARRSNGRVETNVVKRVMEVVMKAVIEVVMQVVEGKAQRLRWQQHDRWELYSK